MNIVNKKQKVFHKMWTKSDTCRHTCIFIWWRTVRLPERE